MKKATRWGVVLLLAASFAFAKEVTLGAKSNLPPAKRIVQVTPWSHPTMSRVGLDELKPLKGERLENTATNGNRFEALLDYTNYPDGPYGGFIFEGTDSALVWFRPATECTVNKLHIRFHSDGELVGQTVYLQLYSIKQNWMYGVGDGTYDFSDYNVVYGDNGPHDSLLAQAPINVTDVGINTEYVVDLSQWGGIVDVGAHDFAIVLGFPEGNGGGADLYYSSYWDDRGQHHGFKYYHGGTGWKTRLNFMIQATVDYYGDPPPFIENAVDLPDVYYSDNPGPYEATATIYDMGTADFAGGLTSVKFIWVVNGTDTTVEDVTSQNPTDSVYVGTISGLQVGDYVSYHWEATDNGADNPSGGVAHTAVSREFHFTVREATEGTTILLVDDNQNGDAINYYAPILEAGGWHYDYWDVNDGGFPTSGVLSNYQTLIWVQGSANGGILADYDMDDQLIAPFLDAGGNFFLSSSDYIGIVEGNFDGQWYDATDPFIINYLHVAAYNSDANVDTSYHRPYDDSADTLYTGVAGSMVSDDLSNTQFVADPNYIGYYNWADEAAPTDDAGTAMLVYSLGDDDFVEAGVEYDGAYKVVFFPWQVEAILDDQVRYDLLASVLGFFGEKAAPLAYYDGGNRYGQAADAGDVTVYGHATDGDGTVTAMDVYYSTDGGNTWQTAAMSDDDGDGIYTGTIPALAVGDTVYFSVRATDNDGLMGYSDEQVVWKLDFTPTGDVLYAGDDPFDWSYGGSVDDAMYAKVSAAASVAGRSVDRWDVDADWLMDTYSVLQRYTGVIWHGYADWVADNFPMATADNPVSDYVAGGGHLLYSSEEMLGTWTDWPASYTFEPGDMAYDVLGIEWLGADYGQSAVAPDPTSNFAAGVDTFALIDTLPFGIMADIVDPIGYPGPYDFPPPFYGYLDDYGFYYTNSVATSNTLTLTFSMAMMPDAELDAFLANVYEWFPQVGTEPTATVPTQFALLNNYPNPFNPTTTIGFEVPKAANVRISIYNLMGQKVTELVNREYAPGRYQVVWNGTNSQGETVASGVYFYRMEAGNFTSQHKMLFLK